MTLAISLAVLVVFVTGQNDGESVGAEFEGPKITVGAASIGKNVIASRVAHLNPSAGSPSGTASPKTEARTCPFEESPSASSKAACSVTDSELQQILRCADDEVASRPYWVREQRPDGTWSGEEQIGSFGCATPQQAARVAAVNIADVVEREFQSLPIVPSSVQIQPGSGWTFVNVPTIVFSSADTQTLQTSVLGVGVEVEVTPEQFSWDFGDDSQPLVTTDPGQPYPGHTLEHTYSGTGTRTITLSTAWSGRFRVAGSGTWQTISGTAGTVSTSDPLEVHEAQARLVGQDLN